MEEEKQNRITILKYIENFLKIKTKDGRIIPFKLNKPQLKLYNLIKEMQAEGKPVRIIILKARQMGFSTLVEAIIFANIVLRENMKAGIITHKEDATTNLLEMFKNYLLNLPPELMPQRKATNTKEVILNTKDNTGLNSQITCMTATNDGVGRSSTYQYLHISEFAFWLCNKVSTYADLMQSVPSTPNSMVFIESTANGYDEFRDMWYQTVNGENDFRSLFVAWYELDDYRKTYNGFVLTDEEIALKKKFNLDNEQIAWRRWCIANNCMGDIRKFHQEYPSTPEEAFLSSGNCIFDIDNIINRLEEIKDKPVKRGKFNYDYVFDKNLGFYGEMTVRNPEFVEDKRGEVWMYEDVEKGVPYVMGCDTAGAGSDWAVIQVIDNRNGKQVLKYKTQNNSTTFTRAIMAIALYYNNALVAIETNYDPSIALNLQTMGYTNQYVREVFDQISRQNKNAFGFRTTPITRPVLIRMLEDLVSEHIDCINDIDTLLEMTKFVSIIDIDRRTSKAQAIKGEHDDHIMALGVALMAYASNQQSHFKDPVLVSEKEKNWIQKSFEENSKKNRRSKWW